MRGGIQIGHGATIESDGVRARAEAIAFAIGPGKAKDIDRVDDQRFEITQARAYEAYVNAWDRATVATQRIYALGERQAISRVLMERSLEKIAQARRALHAAGPARGAPTGRRPA